MESGFFASFLTAEIGIGAVAARLAVATLLGLLVLTLLRPAVEAIPKKAPPPAAPKSDE